MKIIQIQEKRYDSKLMSDISELNKEFHTSLQDLVNLNCQKESNEKLNEKAKNVELTSLRIFGNLNNVKRVAGEK